MEHENNLNDVIRALQSIKPGVEFRGEDDLLGRHILESLEIMMLVAELNDTFGITITLPYIKPDNFRSAETICAMVEDVLDEG